MTSLGFHLPRNISKRDSEGGEDLPGNQTETDTMA